MEAMPARDATEIERLIALIPGVAGIRVVMESQGIAEIHVLGDDSRHPMQLVRDIQSSLLAGLGIRVDQRCISVAQLEPQPASAPRLVLDGVYLALSGDEAEVKTVLHWQERELTGVAKGPATRRNRLVLAAEAVLQAADQLLPTGVRCALETLDTIPLGGEWAVLVLVALIQGSQVQSLAGAAFVRRDETEAAGRATLAALNRRLAVLGE